MADLIERSGDLAPIEEALAAAVREEGHLALVSGPAGIGKTALLRAADERGLSRGFAVLSATGTESERGFPFGVVRQLYRQVHSASTGAESAGVVNSLFAPPSDGGEGFDVSFQVLDGLYWLVADLAQDAPLLIVVDDVQWCDEPSLRHFLYLARRLEGLGVFMLLAERSGEAPGAALEDLHDIATIRVDPAPLSLAGVEELIGRVLGLQSSAAFAAACLEQTGGLPLYLGELLHVVRERGMEPGDDSAGQLENVDAAGLARHVWRRIEAVAEEAATVVGLVSILGEGAEVGRIGLLAELPSARVAELLDGLASQGVLEGRDPPRFTHPVVRASVEARLPPGQVDSWHRDAARLLDRESADIREVAGHLMKSHPEGDAWVVGRLREFSDAVLGPGAPESAVLALRRALAEPPSGEVRVPLLRELARAEDASGDTAAALAHLEDASRLAEDGRERAEIAIDQGEVLAQASRFPDAVEALEVGLAVLAGADPNLEQRIDAELITYAMFSKEVRERGLRRLARYEGEVPDGPAAQPILTAMALASMLTAQPAPTGAALAERALRSGGFRSGGLGIETWTAAAWVMIFTDRPDLAQSFCERELPTVRRQGHPREIFAIESTLACAALRRGDIPTAVSRAQTALAITDRGPHEAWGHGGNALALLDAGDLRAAEQALEAAGPEHWDEETDGSFSLLYARAQLRILQRRLDEAGLDLDELRRRSDALGRGLRSFDDVWRGPGMTLAHRRGDTERARALAAEEIEYARHFGAVGYLGMVLRTAATVSEPGQGLELLRESVELLAPSQFRLEYARSLVELGALLRRGGERIAAREPLAEGLDLAYRCGAGAVVTQALAELRACGARPRRPVRDGVEALTPSETRVALLAAEGRTNREIAQELYVTLKTVEGTLGRAYAKLGISGRGARQALPGALGPLLAGSEAANSGV
jgi:DNA-binding CsgD family transcriptional regulator